MMLLIPPLLTLTLTSSWEAAIAGLSLLMPLITLLFYSPMDITISPSPSISTDPMSTALIILTTWISILMFSSSYKIMLFNQQPALFSQMVLALTLILTTAFTVNDLISYYIFFEASLIPTFILILMWGYQPERLQASMYLMMYTMTASLPLLMGLVFLLHINESIMFLNPPTPHLTNHFHNLTLIAAFLIKMPMYPLHLWLPKAHVEAPVAGSMILASVLLKLGVYGALRTSMFWPQTLKSCNAFIMSLSLTGSLIASIMCLRQHDLKSLIAYASVSHMGLIIPGIYSMSKWAWEGSLTMMITHGLASSGLFSLANMSYEMTKTRSILLMKGLLFIYPSMATWWFILIMSNMAAPPSLNFMAEIFLLTSIIFHSPLYMLPLMVITFFSVSYSLILYSNTHHGPPSNHLSPTTNTQLHFTVCFLHTSPLFLLLPPLSLTSSWT